MHDVKQFLPENKIKMLEKQKYALFGHSAVKSCHYTMSAITEGKMCYKFTFYGINSHQCIQMTPASNFCNQECTFCWRTLGWNDNDYSHVDLPDAIRDESVKMHSKQLSGFGGHPTANMKMWELSKQPKHVAISLTGEPTLYPLLPELLDAYHDKKISTFIVSNGTRPEMIEKLEPTQLYISMDAPNEEKYIVIDRPKEKDSWSNVMRSLEVMANKECRTVLRMTCMKGKNMEEEDLPGYVALIKKSNAMYIEVKGYSWVGFSRSRMGQDTVPTHEEMRAFSLKLAEASGYVWSNEHSESRIHLLVRPDLDATNTRIDFAGFFKAYEKKKALKPQKEITATCTCDHDVNDAPQVLVPAKDAESIDASCGSEAVNDLLQIK
jgi:tRNA wybutosine-synthesizing protein 1